MPDIQRVTSVSILGVTISNRLSVSEHARPERHKQVRPVYARTENPPKSLYEQWCTFYKSVVLTKVGLLVYAFNFFYYW